MPFVKDLRSRDLKHRDRSLWILVYLSLNFDMHRVDQSYDRTGKDTPKWQAAISTTASIPLSSGHVFADYL